MTKTVEFTLNNEKTTADENQSILEIAREKGIDIPSLCYSEREGKSGNCRSCMVEIEGERVLAPSCCRNPQQGMKVTTNNARVKKSQSMILELLQSDMPDIKHTNDSELDYWSEKLGLEETRFEPREFPKEDNSHPAITVNMDSCIQCTRCLRACRDTQNNDVIGLAYRGNKAQIVFDVDEEMGFSTCVACGECVSACPTGALMPSKGAGLFKIDKKVDSVCPYCGVGCQLTYHINDNKIKYIEGKNGPANDGRLCVKGRYGFDYVHNNQRLTKPLIRKEGAEKGIIDPENYLDYFREASWEEVLDLIGDKFNKILNEQSPNSLAGFGCAKGSNEEAYLFQKLIRTGFKTNNVDHCTRLCHASSVVALLECLGSGAVSNPIRDVEKAEVIVVIGANPTANHPVGATWMKNAVRNGSKLILMDPRKTELSRFATHHLQFKPGSDVSMLNAIMNVIIEENLIDEEFIANRTEGFAEIKKHLKAFTPELMEKICGIKAETLREVARLYAKSNGSMILWGMGVSQHIHGTDNARCLISLSLMTGQIGKPGSGLHPLRGQNNVQGASDVGLIPMVYPGYQRVDNPEIQEKFEKFWCMKLDSNPGLTVVEIVNQIYNKKINGLYIMGENPAMSDPDANHARDAFKKLDFMVVQDIFLTETACFADVVLPASAFAEKDGTFTNSDRLVQLGQKAIDMPGEAKQDWIIIQEIAKKMGLDWNYQHVGEVFDEITQVIKDMSGMSWKRLQEEKAIVYPCLSKEDKGQSIIFTDKFPTTTGLGKFVPASVISPEETPDEEYPFVLITGRVLEHWHTGSMTRRASILDELQPEAFVSLNSADMQNTDVKTGDLVKLKTRRGEVVAIATSDDKVPEGVVFMAFCYYEAAANELSIAALDPSAKIPEFKYCALKIEKETDAKELELMSFGGGNS